MAPAKKKVGARKRKAGAVKRVRKGKGLNRHAMDVKRMMKANPGMPLADASHKVKLLRMRMGGARLGGAMFG